MVNEALKVKMNLAAFSAELTLTPERRLPVSRASTTVLIPKYRPPSRVFPSQVKERLYQGAFE
jgi:hypothetical protein